jgi:hypothetical protein
LGMERFSWGKAKVQYGRGKEWVNSKTGLRREIGDTEEDKRRRRNIRGEKGM